MGGTGPGGGGTAACGRLAVLQPDARTAMAAVMTVMAAFALPAAWRRGQSNRNRSGIQKPPGKKEPTTDARQSGSSFGEHMEP
jgi:hypothetical protein